MTIALGCFIGFVAWFLMRYLVAGLYTVNQNERAVKTSFGRAQRIGDLTTLDDPIAEHLTPDQKARYCYPQVRVIPPGGPYFKWPWEKVHKVSIATGTVNMAWDPDDASANRGGTVLDAVTKDQLDVGLNGQIRFRVSERNLYAFIFGVRNPYAHVMGYFVSVLRERIANFEAPPAPPAEGAPPDSASVIGISINDIRKNLRDLNEHMDRECQSSAARYGMVLDASLITGIDPPTEVESALAAINTAYNQASQGAGNVLSSQIAPAIQQNINGLAGRGMLNSTVAGDVMSKTMTGLAGNHQANAMNLNAGRASALADSRPHPPARRPRFR